jgi:hypothetical protein
MVVRQMKRYFISQAPRFGSYKNPVHWKIELSPYYFWWLALRNAKKFHASGFNVDFEGFNGFGEILYGGNSHIEFTNWWVEKMPNGEKRGEYLFGEPLSGRGTSIVSDVVDAEAALLDKTSILVRIDLDGQRKFIDAALDRIIRKSVVFEKGRAVKNPTLSRARYSLTKPVQVEVLKRVFHVFELKAEGTGFSNYDVFRKIGYNIKRDDDEPLASYRRRISTLVSRDYGTAKGIISRACEGKFP